MRAQRPSLTAIKVARGIAFVAEDARVRELLPQGSVELNAKILEASRLMKPWMANLYRKPWFRSFAFWSERHTTPGQIMTLPVRKRFMDDEVTRAIAAGASQLLLVGAGLDTLALRLARQFPDVQCFELDHPATQQVKRAAVESSKLDRPNLHFVAVDLAAVSLSDALTNDPNWRDDARSVVSAEGVLMYLDEVEVAAFLRRVRASTATGSTLLFTYIRSDAHGELMTGRHAGFVRATLKVVGEPLKWGIGEEGLAAFLADHGYTLEQAPTPEDLRTCYLEPVGLGDEAVGRIEWMAAAKAT